MSPAHDPPAAPPVVLVVVDPPAEIEALADALSEAGYRTVRAPSGSAALETLRETSVDLLLADLAAPSVGGLSLHQAALRAAPDLAVVVAVPADAVAAAQGAMQTGALDYVVKPLERWAVLAALGRALGVRRLRRDNAALERRLRDQALEVDSARRELDAFSYSVSHDLRAPLRGIDGFARILFEDHGAELPPPAQRLLEKISANTARMGQLIEELLRLIQLGRQPLCRQEVDVSALVCPLVDELRRGRADSPLEIRVGDLARCTADPSLLRQVFANLLSNAAKFSRKVASPLIEIDSRVEDGGVVYSVRDNGSGFDTRYAQRLFGVFQRFHKESDFEGAGVGLSVARQIVARHGGRIWAESEVDKGATFSFWLAA